MYWDMAGNTILEPHISEFEVGSYKLGHRHPYEAIILTLNGKGFSLAGKNNLKDNESVKMDWKAGSVVSPPFFWFHQHFNTGATVARYLAITEGDFPKRLGIPLEVEQIEKDQEDPAIKRMFDAEVQRARQQGRVHTHDHGQDHDHDHDHEHHDVAHNDHHHRDHVEGD
jgi:gentisate 1,2-dioxygenase